MLSPKTYEVIGRIWIFLLVLSLLGSLIAAGINYSLAKRNESLATPNV